MQQVLVLDVVCMTHLQFYLLCELNAIIFSPKDKNNELEHIDFFLEVAQTQVLSYSNRMKNKDP